MTEQSKYFPNESLNTVDVKALAKESHEPVCDGSHEAEHVGKPTHRDKAGNLRCQCGYILELAKSCDVRSNFIVPDSPEYLARWIWQNYVGIPGADLPPYDAEFTRLLDRIKNLGKLCECGHNHGISIHGIV